MKTSRQNITYRIVSTSRLFILRALYNTGELSCNWLDTNGFKSKQRKLLAHCCMPMLLSKPKIQVFFFLVKRKKCTEMHAARLLLLFKTNNSCFVALGLQLPSSLGSLRNDDGYGNKNVTWKYNSLQKYDASIPPDFAIIPSCLRRKILYWSKDSGWTIDCCMLTLLPKP